MGGRAEVSFGISIQRLDCLDSSFNFFEVATGIVDIENAGAGILSLIFSLAILVPSISVTTRRLHDRGMSGWWQLSYVTLIGIFVVFVLCALPAKDDENKWGRNSLLKQQLIFIKLLNSPLRIFTTRHSLSVSLRRFITQITHWTLVQSAIQHSTPQRFSSYGVFRSCSCRYACLLTVFDNFGV